MVCQVTVTAELLTDTARLAAVERLLPVAAAARTALDRLAELAAVVMNAPIGLVNLIGEEQYLVGMIGLGEPFATTRRVALRVGYCPGTLLSGKPVFVEDAAKNPDFADHPGYTELGLRAYAGAPLRAVDGHLIGSVCVADTRAHRWRRTNRDALAALALSVESELALHQDVDRRRQLLGAFEGAPSGIVVTRGREHIVDYLNPAYRTAFGDIPLGVPARTVLPDLPEEFFGLMDRALVSGEIYRRSDTGVELVWPGEQQPRTRYFDFSYSRIGTAADALAGVLLVAVEVTDRVVAHRELTRHARRQEVLARATAALHRSLDPATELRALAWAAVPELADLATVHLLGAPMAPGEPPPLPVVTDRVVVAASTQRRDLPRIDRGMRWTAGSPVADVIAAGGMVLPAIDVTDPPRWAHDVGTAALIRSGLHTVAAAPVVVDDLVVAVVLYGCFADRQPWNEDELAVLGQLANDASHALSHGLSYQHTRDTALTLQRSLLTAPPAVAGLDICARYQPASADEIGGDWYDAFLLDEDTLAIVVGDIVGHDMMAAAAMGQLRATLRSLAIDRAEDPADVLARLDSVAQRLAITKFATLVHGQLRRDGGSWTLRWANAGHPAPLLLATGAAPRLLDQATGLFIGTHLPHADGTSASVTLRPGDTLLLYTDGLIERRGEPLAEGLTAMTEAAVAHVGRSLDTLCDALLQQAPTNDDVAVLAVRVQRSTG